MALNQVQPFLEKAFEFLRSKEFSISSEDWKTYCKNQNINLENLKKAKAELLRQSPNTSDDTERLQQIFCCDPFDEEIIKSLRNIWHKRAETQPEPFEQWYYDISIHLLNLNTDSFKQKSTPTFITQGSLFPQKSTSKEILLAPKKKKNLPSASFNNEKLRLRQIISTKKWIFISPVVYCFLLLKIFPPLIITLPIYQLILIIYFTLYKKNKLLALGISILASILSFIIIRIFILEGRYIIGNSMSPTIQNEDRVVVDKTNYFFTNYQPKDIIILKMTNDTISRIVGISGDKVYMEQGIIYVNNIPFNKDRDINNRSFEEFTVPADSYFVLSDNLGDNPAHSYWGLVPRSNIIGKVTGRFYPFDRFSLIK